MSSQVENSTKTIKVAEDTWQSVSHESTDRKASIGLLMSIAWDHFMKLPEARREAMVREVLRRESAA